MEHAYEYIVNRCHNIHMDFGTYALWNNKGLFVSASDLRKSEADTKSRIFKIVANYEVHVECAHL